jgi:hypothetical protein
MTVYAHFNALSYRYSLILSIGMALALTVAREDSKQPVLKVNAVNGPMKPFLDV